MFYTNEKEMKNGHGGYGNYERKILFGGYIAYFEKEDTIVVKHIKISL